MIIDKVYYLVKIICFKLIFMGAILKFPEGGTVPDDRDPEPQSPKSTDSLPSNDQVEVKRLPEYLKILLKEQDKINKWECLDVMELVYKVLKREMPRVFENDKGELVIVPNNETELKDCKAVRQELRDILQDQLAE